MAQRCGGLNDDSILQEPGRRQVVSARRLQRPRGGPLSNQEQFSLRAVLRPPGRPMTRSARAWCKLHATCARKDVVVARVVSWSCLLCLNNSYQL